MKRDSFHQRELSQESNKIFERMLMWFVVCGFKETGLKRSLMLLRDLQWEWMTVCWTRRIEGSMHRRHLGIQVWKGIGGEDEEE